MTNQADTSYADYVDSVLAKGPRCGCLDVALLGESRWGLKEVAWGIANYPSGGLSQQRVAEIYAQAFASWSAVCGLKFKQVAANQANIVIGTGRGQRSNFDGPSGTLAWAYLPGGSNYVGQVEVRFDLDETWIDNPQANGILLLNVAAHEFGHAIGLSHNNVRANLLNPIYNRSIATPQAEDIRQIVSLYGQPTANPTPTPTPTPTPGTPSAAPKAVKILLADGNVAYADNFRIIPANAMIEGQF